ncbi:tRNA modification GTPase MnmE [Rickettsiales endosymbiont of Paramecium tredecaurelia]|uniref:tRNA uridine-5-carboxymethylaminomethyl(34) synthesis GTPase MnmE n=1 Tax=Candidatus Sarmatiella mevalonica TaxID=2770581 RepID=UPI0019247D34|nr:tRNA uridine-5-carboxymethylaminomethyl(34) synthesis GTPase MnmE [Candidatus Sarmatiella mevalonica]MBL3284874.1 tRNA modification GTPase MnmE [Candidatus Sarmatiella mevalonica]
MYINTTDTIFAQSSASGKSGVAVFRISGSNSLALLRALLLDPHFNPKPRYAYYKDLYHPAQYLPDHKAKQTLIDKALILYFQAPNSFNGQDIVELHTHGSRAVSKMLYEIFSKRDDVRIAHPGEFTKRAFFNGKLDLIEAHGIHDLIEAQTFAQHHYATQQMNGQVSQFYQNLRYQLSRAMALIEAYIDFPDEDIAPEHMQEVETRIRAVQDSITKHINDEWQAQKLRDGLKIAILGKPNSGKSTLINYLSKREVSIVSEIAGTTRDVVESMLDIGGYPFILQDTAGIRHCSTDLIEQKGIEKAKRYAQDADIQLLLYNAQDYLNNPQNFLHFASEIIDPSKAIILINKIDLLDQNSHQMLCSGVNLPPSVLIHTSVQNDKGLEQLHHHLTKKAQEILYTQDDLIVVNECRRRAMKEALNSLSNVRFEDLVLDAEELRIASQCLHSIIGKIDVEDLLDEIFSSFCIGK